jgi:hypothetical protein
MTSLTREHGEEQDLDGFAATVCERFADVYERRPVQIEPVELVERVPEARAFAGEAAPVP